MKVGYPLLILGSAGIVVLDQITKWAVLRTIPLYESFPLIDGLLNLCHVRNRGVAFGFLNRAGSQVTLYLLILVTLVAVVLVVVWFGKLRSEGGGRGAFGLSLILGGAVGNLVDRVRLGEVVDFLDFHLGAYHWPAFNVADSAVTVGTLWLALNLLFPDKSGSHGPVQGKRKG
jgi:signal peptidase II